MADWLAGVDLLDPGAVAAAARPVMAAMTNPNGLDRAESCYQDWLLAYYAHDEWKQGECEQTWTRRWHAQACIEHEGLDLMDGKDWCESATGVRA